MVGNDSSEAAWRGPEDGSVGDEIEAHAQRVHLDHPARVREARVGLHGAEQLVDGAGDDVGGGERGLPAGHGVDEGADEGAHESGGDGAAGGACEGERALEDVGGVVGRGPGALDGRQLGEAAGGADGRVAEMRGARGAVRGGDDGGVHAEGEEVLLSVQHVAHQVPREGPAEEREGAPGRLGGGPSARGRGARGDLGGPLLHDGRDGVQGCVSAGESCLEDALCCPGGGGVPMSEEREDAVHRDRLKDRRGQGSPGRGDDEGAEGGCDGVCDPGVLEQPCVGKGLANGGGEGIDCGEVVSMDERRCKDRLWRYEGLLKGPSRDADVEVALRASSQRAMRLVILSASSWAILLMSFSLYSLSSNSVRRKRWASWYASMQSRQRSICKTRLFGQSATQEPHGVAVTRRGWTVGGAHSPAWPSLATWTG